MRNYRAAAVPANDWMCFIKYVTWIIIFTYLRSAFFMCHRRFASTLPCWLGPWKWKSIACSEEIQHFQRLANDSKMSYWVYSVRSADFWPDFEPHSVRNSLYSELFRCTLDIDEIVSARRETPQKYPCFISP